MKTELDLCPIHQIACRNEWVCPQCEAEKASIASQRKGISLLDIIEAFGHQTPVVELKNQIVQLTEENQRLTDERDRRISDYKAVVEALHAADKRAEAVEATLAKMTAERDKACSLLKTTGGGYIPLDTVAIVLQRDAAEAALSAHREALKDYADHKPDCGLDRSKGWPPIRTSCTCGFTDRLASLASPKQEEVLSSEKDAR